MINKIVTLANARANLSNLIERITQGERVVITKHGQPVVQLVAVETERQPINGLSLRLLTDQMPMAKDSLGGFMRKVREAARY